MIICNGRGDGKGGHCCWINGEVCEFLFTDRGGTPRCGVWDEMGTVKWREAPVGVWFAERYPGYDCQDWPQNIPEAPNTCCWSDD